MSRTDREDAVARALDLLPHDDGASSDPRLLRDPELVEEARATREAAADVWLATSPLRAAPSDVLHSILDRIQSQTPLADRRRGFFPWLAASGWAAAAMAMILWPKDLESGSRTVVQKEAAPVAEAPETVQQTLLPAAGPARGEERLLKRELLKLRTRLERISDEEFLTAPRVMALNSPGAMLKTPEEARQRVWSVLTGALRSALEAESGAPSDPAALVIERGWLPEGVTALEDGGVIRHRNFPEHSWGDLGLMRSDDGSYYDPARQLLWTADPEGRGFVGRKATDDDDLAAFKEPGEALAMVTPEPRREPEGFVIEDPVTNEAEVVIDQVPPPEEGCEQVVVWTDVAGAQNSIKVASADGVVQFAQNEAAGAAPLVIQATGAGLSGRVFSNTIVFTIPSSGGVRSFQLIETPIKPNGKAHKVIVTGGQSSTRSRGGSKSRGG